LDSRVHISEGVRALGDSQQREQVWQGVLQGTVERDDCAIDLHPPRAGALAQPTSQMIRAQKEGLLAAIKRGEVDCASAFVGGGGISITNADSAEELNQRRFGSPMGLFYEFDVRPLADYGEFMDTVAQALETREKQVDK
jgi:hypothetical protein